MCNRQLGSYQAFSFITPMLLRLATKQTNIVCLKAELGVVVFRFFSFFSSSFFSLLPSPPPPLLLLLLLLFLLFFPLFSFFPFFFFFSHGADGPHIYVRTWTLRSFHKLIRTQTFRWALTASIWTAARA